MTRAGVWSAPGRVNVIGEHTDYNEGFVLPFAIDARAVVAASLRDDDVVVVRSAQIHEEVAFRLSTLAPGRVPGWAAYAAGVLWALRQAGHHGASLDLRIDSAVPAGSGLSSSAALECAVAVAVAALWDARVAPEELARLARRAENEFVGVPCGLMDQMAAMTCTAGHALYLDTRTGAAEQVPLDPAAAGLAILLIDTRVRHQLASSAYADRRRACQEAARALGVPALRDVEASALGAALEKLPDAGLRRVVRHVVTENARVHATVDLLRAGRLADIGPLLTASHASLRDDYRVSCAELDTAVDAALAAGALGARLTGGGFGGCAIALVSAERTAQVSETVAAAFDAHDFTSPSTRPVTPSAGARRD